MQEQRGVMKAKKKDGPVCEAMQMYIAKRPTEPFDPILAQRVQKTGIERETHTHIQSAPT